MARRGGTIVLNGLPPGLFPSSDYQHGARWHYAFRVDRRNQADFQEALAFAGEGLRFMPPDRYYANAGEVMTDLSPASVLGRQVLEDAISFFYLSEARLTSMVSKP